MKIIKPNYSMHSKCFYCKKNEAIESCAAINRFILCNKD